MLPVPKPERDIAKERAQALKQERVARALNLYTTLGTLGLGLGKTSPAERAAEILDYDTRTLETSQLELTDKLWNDALETLKECASQWKAKHAGNGCDIDS